MNKNEFQLWMKEVEDLSESTIKGYIDIINREWPSIYEIDSLEELEDYRNDYLSDPINNDRNEKSKKKIESSINKYIKFIEEGGGYKYMNEKIDFVNIINHFNSEYISKPHISEEKLESEEQKNYYQRNADNAKQCRNQFESICSNIDYISENTLEFISCNQWQHSGTFFDYFWIELKSNIAKQFPSSISIFAEKEGIKVIIEIRDDATKDKKGYDIHNQYLNSLDINKDDLIGHVKYWTKKKPRDTEEKDIKDIDEDIKKLHEGHYLTLQLGDILNIEDLKKMKYNDILNWINRKVEFLYPYYLKCTESVESNGILDEVALTEDEQDNSDYQNDTNGMENYKFIEFINIITPNNRCKDETSLRDSTGNYEARMQVYKQKRKQSGKGLEAEMEAFFNNFKGSNIYTFDKNNLVEYMNKIRFEYEHEVFNKYNSVSIKYWEDKLEKINNFKEDKLAFNISNKLDDKNRYYISSKDKIFSEFKGYILLPQISCIKIEKYKEINSGIFKYIFKIDISDDYKDQVDKILDLIEKLKKNDSILKNDTEEIAHNLNRNLIISGAPGTGKSYNLEEDRKKYFGDRYERVTFYSNYTYNQFVGTYKPKPKFDEEKKEYISYEFIPGPFLRILVKSINDKQNKPHLLIIEEINRANAANVFGDIFQLLDRRSGGRSQYGISISEDMKKYLDDKLDDKVFNDELHIPSNLYIWCTMNSADQGVYPMDTAFKRRFEFEFTGINEGQNIIQDININVLWQEDELKWNDLRIAINNKLRESRQVKEDKLIGPFFISKSVLEGDSKAFNKSFKNKLLMYLYEDICKYDKLIMFDKDYATFSELIEAYESGHKVLNINIESNKSNLSKPEDNNNLQ